MPILKDLNHYELCQLSDMLEPKEHKAGDVLMKQGEPGDKSSPTCSGESFIVRCSASTSSNRERLRLV